MDLAWGDDLGSELLRDTEILVVERLFPHFSEKSLEQWLEQ